MLFIEPLKASFKYKGLSALKPKPMLRLFCDQNFFNQQAKNILYFCKNPGRRCTPDFMGFAEQFHRIVKKKLNFDRQPTLR